MATTQQIESNVQRTRRAFSSLIAAFHEIRAIGYEAQMLGIDAQAIDELIAAQLAVPNGTSFTDVNGSQIETALLAFEALAVALAPASQGGEDYGVKFAAIILR